MILRHCRAIGKGEIGLQQDMCSQLWPFVVFFRQNCEFLRKLLKGEPHGTFHRMV
jgi:hypothetical protein